MQAAQGATVDRGYVVTGGRSDSAALYVGMTRGRDRNTAVVALQSENPDAAEMVIDPDARPTARSILEDCLERESTDRAARLEAEADEARLKNLHTVLGLIESGTQKATRSRIEADLDQLVVDGLLSTEDRARLVVDQSSEHLSRLLRAGEQAGFDPADLLREAIAQRPLEGSHSVAQVRSHRIISTRGIEAAQPSSVAPERLNAAHAEYIAALQEQVAERSREQGSQVAQEQLAWATTALGTVPEGAMERLEWGPRPGRSLPTGRLPASTTPSGPSPARRV